MVAVAVYSAAVCTVTEPTGGCDFPAEGSREAATLDAARAKAAFTLLYPCDLPEGQGLTSVDVTGAAGRQSATMFFDGPFEISVRQSQVAPIQSADPAGASHIVIELLAGVNADLIERNDGSRRAEYRIVWARGGFYYEVLALGPPLSRRQIVNVAKTLE